MNDWYKNYYSGGEELRKYPMEESQVRHFSHFFAGQSLIKQSHQARFWSLRERARLLTGQPLIKNHHSRPKKSLGAVGSGRKAPLRQTESLLSQEKEEKREKLRKTHSLSGSFSLFSETSDPLNCVRRDLLLFSKNSCNLEEKMKALNLEEDSPPFSTTRKF